MRTIKIEGETKEELIGAIKFVLQNQQYRVVVDRITNMKKGDKHLFAYSFRDDFCPTGEAYKDTKLPFGLNLDAFCEVVSDWYNEQESPNSYGDMLVKKGFMVHYGFDFGEFRIDSEDNGIEVTYNNLYSICISMSPQYYGK